MTFNRWLKPLLVAALALNLASAICLVPEDGEKPAAKSPPSKRCGNSSGSSYTLAE